MASSPSMSKNAALLSRYAAISTAELRVAPSATAPSVRVSPVKPNACRRISNPSVNASCRPSPSISKLNTEAASADGVLQTRSKQTPTCALHLSMCPYCPRPQRQRSHVLTWSPPPSPSQGSHDLSRVLYRLRPLSFGRTLSRCFSRPTVCLDPALNLLPYRTAMRDPRCTIRGTAQPIDAVMAGPLGLPTRAGAPPGLGTTFTQNRLDWICALHRSVLGGNSGVAGSTRIDQPL